MPQVPPILPARKRSLYFTAIAIALLTAVAIALGGCGSSSTPEQDSASDAGVSSSQSPETQSTDLTPTSGGSITDYSDFTLDASHQGMFSEGLAWVWLSPGEDNAGPALIDSDGNIILNYTDGSWEETQVPLSSSNFSHGVCLVATASSETGGDQNYCLIDKNGNTLWSSSENGSAAAEEYFGEGSVGTIAAEFDMNYLGSTSLGTKCNFLGADWFNGYTVISFDVTTYEETGTKYGVLDPDGNWAVEPGESAFKAGKYCAVTTNYEINFQTGSVTKHKQLSDDSMGAEGSPLSKRFDKLEAQGALKAHDGLAIKKLNSGAYAFVNDAGSTAIKLGKYNITDGSASFSDGYCSLFITGKDGKGDFVTVIETDGKEMFSPISYDSSTPWDDVPYSECAFAADGSYYDENGKRLGDVEADACYEFSGGRAWFTVDNEDHCIDSNGNQVF